MSKRTKIIVIVIVAAIAVYLVYRWWQNRQDTGTDTSGFGSNLNSVAPDLVGGSAGPDSGLNYYPGNTQVDINVEGQPGSTPPVNPPPPKECPPGYRRSKTGKCEKIPTRPPKRKPKSGWKVSNRPPIVKPGARP